MSANQFHYLKAARLEPCSTINIHTPMAIHTGAPGVSSLTDMSAIQEPTIIIIIIIIIHVLGASLLILFVDSQKGINSVRQYRS